MSSSILRHTTSKACSKRRALLRSFRSRSCRRLPLVGRDKNGLFCKGFVTISCNFFTAYSTQGTRPFQSYEIIIIIILTASFFARSSSAFLRNSGICRSKSCNSKTKNNHNEQVVRHPTIENRFEFI